jgi:hypothetical protein
VALAACAAEQTPAIAAVVTAHPQLKSAQSWQRTHLRKAYSPSLHTPLGDTRACACAHSTLQQLAPTPVAHNTHICGPLRHPPCPAPSMHAPYPLLLASLTWQPVQYQNLHTQSTNCALPACASVHLVPLGPCFSLIIMPFVLHDALLAVCSMSPRPFHHPLVPLIIARCCRNVATHMHKHAVLPPARLTYAVYRSYALWHVRLPRQHSVCVPRMHAAGVCPSTAAFHKNHTPDPDPTFSQMLACALPYHPDTRVCNAIQCAAPPSTQRQLVQCACWLHACLLALLGRCLLALMASKSCPQS